MGLSRNFLLWCSKNPWLVYHVPKYSFVKRALKRFMPGEELTDAINAAADFLRKGIPTIFTHLGENIIEIAEAEKVRDHYLYMLEQIYSGNIKTEVSLKLTQLGLDFSFEKSLSYFNIIAGKAAKLNNFVWIDMEGSLYTKTTLDFYKSSKAVHNNAGICLQSYLKSTKNDLETILDIKPNIRLVKGAYKEPEKIAFESKSEVDRNYLIIAQILLTQIKEKEIRAAFATHDLKLINEIEKAAARTGIPRDQLEFQMLYGIKPNEQLRLVKEGYKLSVLISYGAAWYPWYMRRLAERPANVGFVLKNIIAH